MKNKKIEIWISFLSSFRGNILFLELSNIPLNGPSGNISSEERLFYYVSCVRDKERKFSVQLSTV